MNSKIKNYVDVLFNDIPNTRKASELKEEILSTLNDHFEAHINEGASENQAYTAALADLGDVDELLKSIAPEKDIMDKLNKYKKFKARNMAIAVSLYIIGAICLIAPPALSAVFEWGTEEKCAVFGLLALLIFVAIATGIIIYTKISVPQDVEPYLKKEGTEYKFNNETKSGKFLSSFMKVYGLILTVIYLGVSFATGRWEITWLIWLIGAAVRQVICGLYGEKDNEK